MRWATGNDAELWIDDIDESSEAAYVDLQVPDSVEQMSNHDPTIELDFSSQENPERLTGYSGKSPRRIWQAIYEENCFESEGAMSFRGPTGLFISPISSYRPNPRPMPRKKSVLPTYQRAAGYLNRNRFTCNFGSCLWMFYPGFNHNAHREGLLLRYRLWHQRLLGAKHRESNSTA